MESNVKEPTRIASQARPVALWLATSFKAKQHGGYQQYQDDRLWVTLDTYVPNVSVRVYLDDEWVTVFSAQYNRWEHPLVYRQGCWIGYLHHLAGRAADRERQHIAQAEAARIVKEAVAYNPIDDAAVFEEWPGDIE